jgi:4-hydroxybenzoate polyprenyltransferase
MTTKKIFDCINLLRPYQYTKNLFIFIPPFFAIKLHDMETLESSFFAFISFSLIASAIYILNDWLDRKDDLKHPKKRYRPLASGSVKPLSALILFIICFFSSMYVATHLPENVLYLLLVYFVMNLFYCISLKHIAILDIATISTGFVLRLFVGAEASSVGLSHWIIVMTFLLALFLSLAKRRDDVLILSSTDKKMRKVVDGYNIRFLDTSMVMTSSILILAYILWSISKDVITRIDSQNLYLTSFFVLLGILRYMQITFVYEKSGNPSKVLLKDTFIKVTVGLWVASFLIIIYF